MLTTTIIRNLCYLTVAFRGKQAIFLSCLIFILRTTTVDAFSQQLQSSALSYDEMKNIEKRLQDLENNGPDSLFSFYEDHLNSFSVKPGASRLSITSTCCALNAILSTQNKQLYESFITMDTRIIKTSEGKDNRVLARNIIEDLLASEWRENDLFQVPLLLSTILDVDSKRCIIGSKRMDESMANNLRKLITAVLNARPLRRNANLQIYSEYISFHCALCYYKLEMGRKSTIPDFWEDEKEKDDSESHDDIEIGGIPIQALPEGAASQLLLAISRSAEISENELCRQLAFRTSADTGSFDVMRLVYSMLTYVVSTKSLEGTAGREIIRNQGLSRGTRVVQANVRLIEAGLKAFFEEQKDDGMWDKGQPIYKAFKKTGRNIGNAFVFAVDPVACLLEHLPAQLFRPHWRKLEKTIQWIESHRKVEVLPDYCDPRTGQCTGRSLTGWTSPHLSPEIGPQAWSTAQTVACISRLNTLIQSVIHINVMTEFQGSFYSRDGISSLAWDRLLNSDLGKCGTDQERTLKDVIEERMIQPRLESSTSPYPASYSAILFGPPGTAKSTICESLAKRIGWDFVVIDTSDFLADGLMNVASRIRYVFERLQSLKDCVILFDEIEEFCLDRETPGLGMESRMLTTAMLTAINDLRRKQKSIFVLATNRLRAFDAAITRPGRFDMQLFVGTPNLNARVQQFRQKLNDIPVEQELKLRAIDTYTQFLETHWIDEARFMNYLEGMQFAGACANIVSKGYPLSVDEMKPILDAQAALMTVRGQIRQEYLASMSLTRL